MKRPDRPDLRPHLATLRLTLLSSAVLALLGAGPATAWAQSTGPSETVVVTAPRPADGLAPHRNRSSDAARLLDGTAGVSLYEAGGLSALPALHGLADERIRIQVDGMDLMAACPNHMNSPLSYIDATRVDSVKVWAGISPVSAGGDSIAGTIQIAAPPRFAAATDLREATARLSSFYRSNGQARGASLNADLIAHDLHLSYSGASAQSKNYRAGGPFKAAGLAALGKGWLDGDEVGSSAYKTENQDFGVATRWGNHQLQFNLSRQHIPYELYPNQRMDMTGNDSTQLNLRYAGTYAWGSLTARAFQQSTRHLMDMGPDRADYGTGMPMDTKSRTGGATVQGEVPLPSGDRLRVGAELQAYEIYDWWSPVGTGMMAPRTFWNVDYGTRDRAGVFGEWDLHWSEQWQAQVGIRHDVVQSDTGPVQGYNADPIWSDDAAAFNARPHERTDRNWDFTLLGRYQARAELTLEGGLARKSRAPSVYERFPWSQQAMASLMNNFVGDGNGYIGNLDLQPEVAHTLSLGADWHDAAQTDWSLKATGYLTQVQDFIDAERCASTLCGGAANVAATTGFVNLRYVNQSARLYGLDVTGQRVLVRTTDWGRFDLSGGASYVHGVNRDTGSPLYHIMPLQGRIALTQHLAAWTHALELRAVSGKTRVSAVRNEVPTGGYALVGLRTSLTWGRWRLDAAVENLFDRSYALPLGGAYTGQGASMATTSLPWGVTVPGRGRSIDLTLTAQF